MPQKDMISDFEKATGRIDATASDDLISDFETHRATTGTKKVPTTPADINAQLPSGADPVGQRSLTPAEREMTATAPTATGPHGEVVPTGAHPLAATINPVTKKPFPGQTQPLTHEQNMGILRDAAPWAAAAVPAMVGMPEASWPVRVGTAAILAGGTKAATQFFDPKRPDSAAARGLDILKTSAEVGTFEAGAELTKMGAGSLLRRYFPSIAEAIEQGTQAFLHAVPSNDIGVRANYSVAQGDLQAIAKEMLLKRSTLGIANPGTGVFSHSAPGGIISTELRPTELWTAIKDYLSRMYTDERQWQIMQAGGQQIMVNPARAAKFDPNVYADAMRRVARIPDIEEGAHKIAARVAANPTAPITVEEADILERSVSSMLRKFNAGTGSRQAVEQSTMRNIALMTHANEMLNDSLNYSLQQGGLPGINGYARRYAALARVQDNLERMIPNSERGRLGLGPAEVVSPSKIVRTLTTAVGQNPGREIESAMRILARADDIPRPTGIPINPLPAAHGPNVGGPAINLGGAGGAGAAGGLGRPPAGPPLNLGQPPTLPPAGGGGVGAGAPAGAPAASVTPGMPPPPSPPVYNTISSLRSMRAKAVAAGADEATIAHMDKSISEMEERLKDVGPPPGHSERRASRLGGMPKLTYETDANGTKWATLGKFRVSIPPNMLAADGEAYARQKLAEQASFLNGPHTTEPRPPDDFAF